MTIEIMVQSSEDAFSENSVANLKREAFSTNLALAAAEWVAERSAADDSLQCVLYFIFSKVVATLENYDIWLLTGDTTWQPDTRIVRYRKRFNALKMQGIDFEAVPERVESFIEDDGKLKFFGAVRLNESILPIVPLTMTPRSCTYVVAQPKGMEEKFSVLAGWSGQWNSDAKLVEMIASSGGVMFQRVGFFDDPQVGLLAIGNPIALAKILH